MDTAGSRADFMEQQLAVWLRLAEAIEQAQRALLSGDVAGFEQSTEIQAECCRQYRDLGPGEGGACVSDPLASALLREQIEQARRKVRHLNQVHAALLQRASRSLRILRNLLASPGVPYLASAIADGDGRPGAKG